MHFSKTAESELENIKQAMKVIASVSCIKFFERANQVGYVDITSEESGCWADSGYQTTRSVLMNSKFLAKTDFFFNFLHPTATKSWSLVRHNSRYATARVDARARLSPSTHPSG